MTLINNNPSKKKKQKLNTQHTSIGTQHKPNNLTTPTTTWYLTNKKYVINQNNFTLETLSSQNAKMGVGRVAMPTTVDLPFKTHHKQPPHAFNHIFL